LWLLACSNKAAHHLASWGAFHARAGKKRMVGKRAADLEDKVDEGARGGRVHAVRAGARLAARAVQQRQHLAVHADLHARQS